MSTELKILAFNILKNYFIYFNMLQWSYFHHQPNTIHFLWISFSLPLCYETELNDFFFFLMPFWQFIIAKRQKNLPLAPSIFTITGDAVASTKSYVHNKRETITHPKKVRMYDDLRTTLVHLHVRASHKMTKRLIYFAIASSKLLQWFN